MKDIINRMIATSDLSKISQMFTALYAISVMAYSIPEFYSGHCVRGSIAFIAGILGVLVAYWNKSAAWMILLIHHVLMLIPASPILLPRNVVYLRNDISEVVVVPFSFLRMPPARRMTARLYESLKNATMPASSQLFNASINDTPCPFRLDTMNGMRTTQLWMPGPCDFFYEMASPGSSVSLQLKTYAVAFVAFAILVLGVMLIVKWCRGWLQRPYKKYIYLSPNTSIVTLPASSGNDYATVDDSGRGGC